MALRHRTSSSSRLEAFSDGVFAIAITLLVLDLHAPADNGRFLQQLGDQWPSYVAFVAAFAVLGLIWLSHHDLFSRLNGTDATVLMRNLLLLFPVSLFAFPTAVLASSFSPGRTRTDRIAAIGIYDLAAIAITLAWVLLARVLVAAPDLNDEPAAARAYAQRQGVFGGIACALLGLSFAAAFVSPAAAIAIVAVLPLVNLAFYRHAMREPAQRGLRS